MNLSHVRLPMWIASLTLHVISDGVRGRLAAPAQHRVHPVRRPGLRGREVPESRRQDSHAEHGSAGRRRHDVHRRALRFQRLLADAVRRPDGPLQLAVPTEARRAGRPQSAADRTGSADGRGVSPAARLPHGGDRQMAPGHGLGQTRRPRRCGTEHRIRPASAERRLLQTDRQRPEQRRLRLLLRHQRVAGHGAVHLHRERSRHRPAHGRRRLRDDARQTGPHAAAGRERRSSTRWTCCRG